MREKYCGMALKKQRDFYIKLADSIIDLLPPIQPKRGRWLYCEDTTADCVDGYRCDQCGLFVPWDYQHKSIDYIKDYNFCPNCGAKMEVNNESN
jgi:DNA-directed RNA polymerase subunit RPC12/RpoP